VKEDGGNHSSVDESAFGLSIFAKRSQEVPGFEKLTMRAARRKLVKLFKFTSRFGSVFCNMHLKLETGNGNLHG